MPSVKYKVTVVVEVTGYVRSLWVKNELERTIVEKVGAQASQITVSDVQATSVST